MLPSLNADPERVCELLPPEEPFVELNVLRKKGRRVGIQAATMTTFCSMLIILLVDVECISREKNTHSPQITKVTGTHTEKV